MSTSEHADHSNDLLALLAEIYERLVEVEDVVKRLEGIPSDSPKPFYSTAELASLLGKSPYTVREWARLGRLNATKRPVGRGDSFEWEFTREEIERYRNHGLLPDSSLSKH